MKYLRDLSKSTLAACLTGVFAILMVGSSLQGTFSSGQHKKPKVQIAQRVLHSLVFQHKTRFNEDPSESAFSGYLQQAIHEQSVYDRFDTFFQKHGFLSSTKHTISTIQQDKQAASLLEALKNNATSYEAAETIKFIELSKNRETFIHSLAQSAIIPESAKSQIKQVLLQRQKLSYSWLELTEVQVKNQIEKVENEADIQDYYTKTPFLAPASAVITTLTIPSPSSVANTKENQTSRTENNPTKLLTAVQEAKLYHPKNIEKIAQATGLSSRVQKDVHLTEDKLDAPLPESAMKTLFYSQETKPSSSVSNPYKQTDGSYVIYQVQHFTPQQKKPLEQVRNEVIKKIHALQLQQKLKENAELSMQQLRNGTDISEIERKFETKAQHAGPAPQNNHDTAAPDVVSMYAKHIPSTNTGWEHALTIQDPVTRSWYILAAQEYKHPRPDYSQTQGTDTQNDRAEELEDIDKLLKQRETDVVLSAIMASEQ